MVACTPRSRQRIYSLSPNIRLRYGSESLDLSVHVASEGSLTLSIPAPGINSSEEIEQNPPVQVAQGLTEQLDRNTLDVSNQLAKGA